MPSHGPSNSRLGNSALPFIVGLYLLTDDLANRTWSKIVSFHEEEKKYLFDKKPITIFLNLKLTKKKFSGDLAHFLFITADGWKKLALKKESKNVVTMIIPKIILRSNFCKT